MTGLVEVSIQSLPLLVTFSPSFLPCLTDCEGLACQLSVECRLLFGPFPIKHRSKHRHLYLIDCQHSTHEEVHTEKISVCLYFLQENPSEFWVRKYQLKLGNCCWLGREIPTASGSLDHLTLGPQHLFRFFVYPVYPINLPAWGSIISSLPLPPPSLPFYVCLSDSFPFSPSFSPSLSFSFLFICFSKTHLSLL